MLHKRENVLYGADGTPQWTYAPSLWRAGTPVLGDVTGGVARCVGSIGDYDANTGGIGIVAMTRTLLFSGHGVYRMLLRGVTVADVRAVLDAEDLIEEYPDDTPYPSALYFGRVRGRVLHVVAAQDGADQRTIVVTVYEPDPTLWDATLRRRIPA